MGEVFQARDTRLDRIVAVKVSVEQFSDRFEREAKAVAGGKPETAGDAPQGMWAPYHGGIAAYNAKGLYIRPTGAKDWSKLRDLPGVSGNFFRLQSLTFTPDAKWAAMHLTMMDRATLLLVENVR